MDVYPSKSPSNFLFRGNMPVVNENFAYHQIVAAMKSIIQAAGYTMPTNFFLIVVR